MRDERLTIGGRYVLHEPISSGGMASVHFGRVRGAVGFSRTVAIKRMLEEHAGEGDFLARFVDEARLAARIHHPNVVATLDVAAENGEVFLVMEYVSGLSLSGLLREAEAADKRMPPEHAIAIVVGALHGLHAAHEAKNEAGEPLQIVHRDVSPPNILVGEDGLARIIDFGVAKAAQRIHATRQDDAGLHGKIRYMAPEQLARDDVDRRVDIYAASVVAWELLTGRRWIDVPPGNPRAAIQLVKTRDMEPTHVSKALDDVVLRGLAKDPAARFPTALAMATALENATRLSTQREVAAWIAEAAGPKLAERAAVLRRIETEQDTALVRSTPPPPRIDATEPITSTVPFEEPTHVSKPVEAVRASVEPQPMQPQPVVIVRGDRRLTAIAVVLAGVVVVLLGGIAFRRWGSGDPQPPPTQAEFPPPPPTATPTPSEAPPAPTITLTATAEPKTTVTARRAPPPQPRNPCNPPWTLDHGIKVPKPECL
jgi:serine/threonine-protein kinase